jgi:hypothetical protein
MAVCEGPWVSDPYEGVELKTCSRIELRLLNAAGNEVSDMMAFSFEFKNQFDTAPVCKKL